MNWLWINQIIYMVIQKTGFGQLQVTFFPDPLKWTLSSIHGQILSLIGQPLLYYSWAVFLWVATDFSQISCSADLKQFAMIWFQCILMDILTLASHWVKHSTHWILVHSSSIELRWKFLFRLKPNWLTFVICLELIVPLPWESEK